MILSLLVKWDINVCAQDGYRSFSCLAWGPFICWNWLVITCFFLRHADKLLVHCTRWTKSWFMSPNNPHGISYNISTLVYFGAFLNHLHGWKNIIYIYRRILRSNVPYFLEYQLFVKRSQYIKIKNLTHKPACASKQDMLELATLLNSHTYQRPESR